MPQLSKSDYSTLDMHVRTVPKQFEDGKTEHHGAQEDILHPLTAWDNGNAQEFIPYMRMTLATWGKPDADRT